MGYESYLRKRRISVSSMRYKPTGKHRHSLHFSLVYRSVFAQIFPRLQPMRESNTCTTLDTHPTSYIRSWAVIKNCLLGETFIYSYKSSTCPLS
ncbi:unnamed protein product [Tenebrio molitor]|nr:unnamed protein product [Tenebrio molitor]